MPRVKRGSHRREARKKVLKRASGFFLTKSKLHRAAREAVDKSQRYDFRALWIIRINAGCQAAGISYSKFIGGLKKAEIDLNRKVLADIAANDEPGFRALVDKARAALENAG